MTFSMMLMVQEQGCSFPAPISISGVLLQSCADPPGLATKATRASLGGTALSAQPWCLPLGWEQPE